MNVIAEDFCGRCYCLPKMMYINFVSDSNFLVGKDYDDSPQIFDHFETKYAEYRIFDKATDTNNG